MSFNRSVEKPDRRASNLWSRYLYLKTAFLHEKHEKHEKHEINEYVVNPLANDLHLGISLNVFVD
jgi:hypothetical protein